ncbi:VOC family protein [Ammoniphilus sp. 3BR4]|uniref:VOC family protein n=1 Tax=Ammoniphilus sp. 3BR4 TaxID=3158265 RepID=UPI003466E346
MGAGRVTGVYHAGITVKDIEQSIKFYTELLGLELVSRREAAEDYLFQLVAVPGLQMIKLAFLKIPGSDALVELLEYVGMDRFSGSCRSCDYGSGHVCLYVSDLDEMHNRLSDYGVKFKSNAPVLVTSGRNEGCKIIYMMDPDGYIIELVEPPSVE